MAPAFFITGLTCARFHKKEIGGITSVRGYPALRLNEERSLLLMFTEVAGLLYLFVNLAEGRTMTEDNRSNLIFPSLKYMCLAWARDVLTNKMCNKKWIFMYRKVQGCSAGASDSIAISIPTLILSASPPCAYRIPNTVICFCSAKGLMVPVPGWSLL